MFQLRPNTTRGHANFGWLDSKHSFSFGSYHDPNHMGFRNLRVINEDIVQPAMGFGTHGHRDMEIISYVISGGLEHKDSMNNGSVLTRGDVQRMSAGTGVHHSEFNSSKKEPVYFLQIWILPSQKGLTPEYEERNFAGQKHNQLCLLVSEDAADSSLRINSPIRLYASELDSDKSLEYNFAKDRHGWIQVIKGSLVVGDDNLSHTLKAGDGLGISQVKNLVLKAETDCEFLLFDLP